MSLKLNIFQRLNAVMKEVKYVQKEEKMVNGQYRFVSHDAVTAKLHDPLTNHGIVMLPSVLEINHQDITVVDKNGPKPAVRTTCKIEVSFVNIDDPTDKVSIVHCGCGIDPGDKGIGKAVSYAVKYALLKVFCLETGDDVEKDLFEVEGPEQLQIRLLERKNQIATLVGKENIDDLKQYISKLKDIFKSKKEEEIILNKDAKIFVSDFLSWKENKTQAA